MEANPKIEEKLREIQNVEEALGVLHRELGALVAAEMTIVVRPPGKMLVSGPAPAVAVAPTVANVLDAAHGSAAAGPSRAAGPSTAEPETRTSRLEHLLNVNPGRTFTAEEAAEALGEKPEKGHYTLLRRLARQGKVRQAGRGTFAAKRNGRKAG